MLEKQYLEERCHSGSTDVHITPHVILLQVSNWDAITSPGLPCYVNNNNNNNNNKVTAKPLQVTKFACRNLRMAGHAGLQDTGKHVKMYDRDVTINGP